MKNKLPKHVRIAIFSYITFFMLCAFVVSCSFLLFFNNLPIKAELTKEQIEIAAISTFINILIITALFTIFDVVRRKITTERPIRDINSALDKITSGDFNVRLKTTAFAPAFSEIKNSINTMTEELSSVETLRNDFISNVSHEMKTPLAVIGNYATLLQKPDLSEEDRIEYSKTISQFSNHLAELITNILKLNQLENQQIFPEAKSYNLSEQLCECLLNFESTWENKKIDIETHISENISICADSNLLSIVWNNLLSNAFKFTDNGGIVSVSLSADSRFATITITDTGCGMSEETQKHIFEKFYQGDTSHTTKGNGLGLSLAKRIIDIANGEINVSSALDKGSIFTVKLPINNYTR